MACDTDGIDGNSQNAGGFLTPYSIAGATELGLDPTGLLAAHRSAEFFDILGHNVVTGPTLTNVNDFTDFNQVYAELFPQNTPPARSTVCSALAIPGALVEIEAIAFSKD